MSQGTQHQNAVSDQRPVRLLHLSDFHFDAAKAWDADPVLRGLSDSIQQLVVDGLAPDAVAITGDIANKGQAADYERAETWIADGLLAKLPELGIERPPLPVLIRIADLLEHVATSRQRNTGPFGTNSAAWLAHYLTTVSGESAWGLNEAYVQAQLQSGQAIVMFDGLDEAPSLDDRRVVLKLIENIVLAFGQCRFVLTSRPGAYQDDTVLSDFVQVQIDPLEDETVRWFLGRWCQALFPKWPSRSDEHLRELLRALESRPDIRRLARNPVMLTALAVVHWNEKRLPEQRADLYESIITWLARSRRVKTGILPQSTSASRRSSMFLLLADA